MSDYKGDWISDGREEIRQKLEEDESGEYEEWMKENHAYQYWGFPFTPDPDPELAEEIGLPGYES